MERKIKGTKTSQAEKETKKKSSAEQDLYDIVNSDIKWNKEYEKKIKEKDEEFAKKMGWKK